MADNTPNISLPFIKQSQAQKEVTHAMGLVALDALVMCNVLARDVTSPPSTPVNGQRWIVPAAATGAWSGKTNSIAAYYSGWIFYAPLPGWYVYSISESCLLLWTGTEWKRAQKERLADLSDVVSGGSAVSGQVLTAGSGGTWAPHTLSLSDLAGVDMTAVPAGGQAFGLVSGVLQPVKDVAISSAVASAGTAISDLQDGIFTLNVSLLGVSDVASGGSAIAHADSGRIDTLTTNLATVSGVAYGGSAIAHTDSGRIDTLTTRVDGAIASAVHLDSAQTWTAAQRNSPVYLGSGTTLSPDFATANNFSAVLGRVDGFNQH